MKNSKKNKVVHGSFTHKLLKLMDKSRQGLTRPQIWDKLSEEYGNDPEALAVYLSMLVRKKKLRRDGFMPCPGCGRDHAVYRITEEGRTALWLKS
jgi:hypothetical protein